MSELKKLLLEIESYHPTSIDLGLDRIRQVAAHLIPLQFPCPVVTVAGTNGKGSTVAVLAALAQAAGLKVATYTSPHLYQFNERIQINGMHVSDEKLLEALQAVDAARSGVSLTFFEWTSLAAFYYFHAAKPDLIILEVGMGGRLDATNLIDPDIAIITSIGLDHMDYLGHTKEEIALEKAGIMREGKPIICGDILMQALLKEHAQELGAIFYGLGQDFPWLDGVISTLVPSNIACAAKAAELLKLPIDMTVIEGVSVPGRKQHLCVRGKQVILDVAHNEDSIGELAHYLSTLDTTGVHLVMGVMGDKQLGGALQDLAELCSSIHLAAPDTPRAMSPDVLMELIEAPSQVYSAVDAAFAAALTYCRPKDYVVVTGSFYTVSSIQNML